MGRFQLSCIARRRALGLLASSLGLFLTGSVFAGLEKTSFLDAQDKSPAATSELHDRSALTPVLVSDGQPTQAVRPGSQQAAAPATPSTSPTAAPTTPSPLSSSEDVGSAPGLNFGMYDGQG